MWDSSWKGYRRMYDEKALNSLYWCENGIDRSTCIKVCPYNIALARKANVTPKEFWDV